MDDHRRSAWKFWLIAIGIMLIQTFLIIELTAARTVTGDGLQQDIFGFIVSDQLMEKFFLIEAAGIVVGIVGGLVGALGYRNRPFARPCWFVFLFNALSIFWIFLAAAGSA